MSGATMFNLSILTSDMWAVVIRIFFYHQQVDWLYYLAFGVVAIGIIIYSVTYTTIVSGMAVISNATNYWLAFEISEDNAASFKPSLFIDVYVAISAVSVVLVLVRSFFVTYVGLKTAQIFFKWILHSFLHAPMSFFDTTPSGRILSRASTNQSNVDLSLPFFLGMTISLYITVVSIIIITCQYAWPTILLVIPLGWMNIWYRNIISKSLRTCLFFKNGWKRRMCGHLFWQWWCKS